MKKYIEGTKLLDIRGEKFNRLTVLSVEEIKVKKTPNREYKYILWKCICDCGKEVFTTTDMLKRGQRKSCGCLKAEKTGLRSRLTNEYDISGDFGIGYTRKGEKFYFDLEDYDLIKNWCWWVGKNGYLMTNERNNTGKKIYFHKLVTKTDGQQVVDHKNHNKLDNRKRNFAIADSCENLQNQLIKSNNTSGVVGVTYVQSRKKWLAQLKVRKKKILYKYFDTFDEAVLERLKVEKVYRKDYSSPNRHLFDKYGIK